MNFLYKDNISFHLKIAIASKQTKSDDLGRYWVILIEALSYDMIIVLAILIYILFYRIIIS